jgi:hypothetical protein
VEAQYRANRSAAGSLTWRGEKLTRRRGAGQPVKLKLVAFSFQKYGMAESTVESV